ncbi:MAG TPA: hypothetical protein VEC17_01280 [Candidatus Binatia bacterium]|nr:hypothetical protein [Candidatus Binatia bacterium]
MFEKLISAILFVISVVVTFVVAAFAGSTITAPSLPLAFIIAIGCSMVMAVRAFEADVIGAKVSYATTAGASLLRPSLAFHVYP